ncbi:MAG: helix-turn-helix transcriptional regulator [Planctomycetes bacterium]|nr:helix-turn-helix transcriptional regulator [Planctomycetota bacterium]
MAKKTTRSFGDVIRGKLAANPDLAKALEEESVNADIAQQVYDLRTRAKLTQKQLADMVGTQQSVISRIEDADYGGHSLNMLKRIANALERQLRVDFCVRADGTKNKKRPGGPPHKRKQAG